MRLALVGDVHGRFDDLARLLDGAARAGAAAALQTGDFGFRPDHCGALPAFPLPVHAVCGNHEDHAFLDRARAEGLCARWEEKNLFYQPRASHRKFGATGVGFLGGALHVDRPQRRAKGNVIAHAEADEAIGLFNREQPDLIVTHSCPAAIGVGMKADPGFAWQVAEHVLMAGFDPGPPHDCGEAQLTRLWRALERKPILWLFGHFHHAREARVGGTLFRCLPRVGGEAEVSLWEAREMD